MKTYTTDEVMQREAVLKKAMVEAVLPLEALMLSGGYAFHCPEMQEGIRQGIEAVRASLADEQIEVATPKLDMEEL